MIFFAAMPLFFNIILFFASILCLGYILLIQVYHKWFKKIHYKKPVPVNAYAAFSIIIPARNEEDNIEACLHTIFKNEYPVDHYEVIVADDNSEDSTVEKVKALQPIYKNLQLAEIKNDPDRKLNAYKKKAIETAIAQSSFPWIVATDADCMVSNKWLSLYNIQIQNTQPVFIAAPVKYHHSGTFLSLFQCLDFISLQGITAATVSAGFHSMCNGANLAYQKEAYTKVGGFTSIDNIASGDDMLLMYKIQKEFPGKTAFLFHHHAAVTTYPAGTWKKFFNQRFRWASKATHYDDKKILPVLLLVYFFNLVMLLLPFTALFPFAAAKFILISWLMLIAIKTIAELPFMYDSARFFNQQKLLWWFPLMQPFHILYTVLAGFFGSVVKYEWKGRKVK